MMSQANKEYTSLRMDNDGIEKTNCFYSYLPVPNIESRPLLIQHPVSTANLYFQRRLIQVVLHSMFKNVLFLR